MQSSSFQTILVLILYFVILITPSHAQKATFEFYSLMDGLAGNNVSWTSQDAQGMIWVVCDGKLQRFDGQRFISYVGRPNDLPGADELLLNVTSFQDSLLLLASAHHLYTYNPNLDHWNAIPIDTGYFFQEFKFIGEDRICFSVSKKGFSKDLSIWSFHNQKVEPFSVFEGKDFRLRSHWVSTGQFIIEDDSIVYHIQDGVLRKINFKGDILAKLHIPPPIGINHLAKLNDERLLILQKNEFYTVDLDLKKLVPHPANKFLIEGKSGWFHRLLVEQNGSFWASGQNSSLMYYNNVRDTVFNFRDDMLQLAPGILTQMMIDNTGNLWIQTDRGILKVNFIKLPFSNFFNYASIDKEGNRFRFSFRGITEDSNGNIFAAFYIGMCKIDRNEVEHILLPKESKWVPFDIHFRNGNIYLNNGNIVDLSINERRPIIGSTGEGTQDRGVFTLDSKNQLYRIIMDTLYRLDDNTTLGEWVSEFAIPIPNPKVNFPEVLSFSKKEGKFLIGGRNTLYSYDPEERKIQTYSQDDWGLPIFRIMAIEEDSAGSYWLGTDIGLVRFDTHTDEVEHYTTQEGLCNDFVCSILAEGDSALWLGTNQGLSRFNISTRKFVNFYADDGLTTNEFNRASYFKTKDGRMFFGGVYGLNAFYPDEIMESYRRQNERAKLILTEFEKVDENLGENAYEYSFSDNPKLDLYHWDRSFEFKYLLTDYTKTEEVRYSYKMEGYEDRWSEFSRDNSIRFSSLPPGDYTLKVKALDHHGMEHPNQLSVTLAVHPPWWETSWAYLLYVLFGLGIAYTIFRFYMRRWKLQLELQKEHEEAIRLKELDNFKSRLYTNLTHEFRTPLTVILGMTDQLEEDPQKHMQEGIDLIRKNGTQLLKLINQLLDLSKLENNVFQLHFVQGNIIPYLRYLCSSFKAFAKKHQIELTLRSDVDSLIMDFDPDQIKQVMNNLISNAVKFTPAGGFIKIRIEQEGQDLVLEVEDTGTGIKASDLGHIFDRFYQADTSESRKWEGSGIGLAHTRELISLMKGKIEVESNNNASTGPTGTCFKILLPIKTSQDVPVAPDLISSEVLEDIPVNEGIPFSNFENENKALAQILIVEDNPDVVAYLVSCLRSDYQIDVAINGKEGLEKAMESIPDLIISDVMMPEMDGFELCNILKNDERTSHIPVIMLTAKANTSSKVEGLESGADAYLYKPFNKKELLVRITMMIKKKQKLAEYYMRRFQGGLDVANIPEPVDSLPIEDAFILKVRKIIEDNYTKEDFALPDLAKAIGMSRSQLYRKMKALVDTSPSDFIRNYRLGKARQLLQDQELNVSEVAWQVGYKDIAHFSRSYQSAFGENPSEVLKNR